MPEILDPSEDERSEFQLTVESLLSQEDEREVGEICERELRLTIPPEPAQTAVRLIRDVRFLMHEVARLRAAIRRKDETITNLDQERHSLGLSARILEAAAHQQRERLDTLSGIESQLYQALFTANHGLEIALRHQDLRVVREAWQASWEALRTARPSLELDKALESIRAEYGEAADDDGAANRAQAGDVGQTAPKD